MTKAITWKCTECGNEDTYPAPDDVTLEKLQSEDKHHNTMCKTCSAPCIPIKVEQIINS